MRKLLLLIMSMCLCFVGTWAQQNRVLTGKITDEKGSPVAGASVLVKGTSVGVSAGGDGSFSLSVPRSAKTLVVSALNFLSTEINIGNKTSFEVILTAKTERLDEVVVVAYGVVKKEAFTGSVGTIKGDDIGKRPVSNVTSALEGAVPGVVTSSANGQPGSGPNIRIRGFGSINASTDPLYVLDGVPYVGNLSNLNPNDIDAITVLKDAASTALYGSRAANGVVMITTKKGIKGKNNIAIKGSQGMVNRGMAEYDRLDAFQYYPVMWQAYRNSLVYPASGTGISLDSASRVASGLTSRTSIQGLLAYNPFNVPANAIVGTDGKINPNAKLIYGDDLDWTKDLMRTGVRKDYAINLNGGAEKSDYFLSVGYIKEEGFTLRSDLERYTARLNVNVQPRTWLKTGLNLSGNFSSSNTASDGGSTSFVNPFYYSRNVGPIYPVYAHNMTTGEYLLDLSGNKFWDLGNMGGTSGVPNRPSGGFAGRHALAETVLNQAAFNRTSVSGRSYVDISFLKNFKFTNNVSIDYQLQNDMSFENTLVGDGAPAGRSRRISGDNLALTLNQLLNYTKTLDGHRIDVLLGHESYNQKLTNLNGFKQGQTVSGNTELNNFTTINSLTSAVDKYRIESYFSRLSYDFKSKYFVTASIRTDGNSRFASEARWGTFWSVGGGWKIDREDFMRNIKWVDALKLRSTYGVVGVADGIGYYAYQGLYSFANNANEPGIVQSQTAFLNKSLTWEQNKQFDIGLDFSLFKGRLNGYVEYYRRGSDKLLFDVPQPLSSGLLSTTQNTANLYNKGIELQLNGDVIRTKDFTWNVNVNVSTVTNNITRMPDGVDDFVTGTKKYKTGQSIYGYWLRTYYGVDPADGAALYVADNTAIATGRRLITNKSGQVDTVTTAISNGKFDYQGSSIPDLYGSFAHSFSYKGFTLSALFTFQLGGKTYDNLYAGLMSSGTYGGGLHTDILRAWQKPGDVTDVPRMDQGRTTDFNATSSRWLISASYLNIRSISLAYALPSSVTKKLNINNGQVFVSAENLAFFSKRKGMNNQQAFSGVTSNEYPPARIVTAGFTLNF